MIRVEQLKPWHVEILYSEGHIPEEVYSDIYAKAACSGISVAVIHDEKVIGIGGMSPLWEGVADGWSIVTPWLIDHPIAMTKAFRIFINQYSTKFKRVQITVEEGFEQGRAFAEFLGFTPEGRMEYYSPDGKTHIRYARIS